MPPVALPECVVAPTMAASLRGQRPFFEDSWVTSIGVGICELGQSPPAVVRRVARGYLPLEARVMIWTPNRKTLDVRAMW